MRTVNRQAVRSWRPQSGGRLVAPDGSVLNLIHQDNPLSEPWFTESRIRLATSPAVGEVGIRAFETGPVGTVDGHVAVILDGDYVGEYAAQGGTYLLAQNADRSLGLVAWRGRWHEAYCWVNIPEATHSQMLQLLDGLTFTDTPAGLRVRPAPGESYQRITATKHVPGVGMASIVRTPQVARELPLWSGLKIRVGEVWRQRTEADIPGAELSSLVCATLTAVISLHPRDGGDEATALAFLSRMYKVSWL